MNVLDAMHAVEHANEDFNDAMYNHLPISAEAVGLDSRCGRVYIIDDVMVIHKNVKRAFDYYGGFEYIDDEAYSCVGDYVVYRRWEDNRVDKCFDHWEDGGTN